MRNDGIIFYLLLILNITKKNFYELHENINKLYGPRLTPNKYIYLPSSTTLSHMIFDTEINENKR